MGHDGQQELALAWGKVDLLGFFRHGWTLLVTVLGAFRMLLVLKWLIL
jgi:hypothetical protein